MTVTGRRKALAPLDFPRLLSLGQGRAGGRGQGAGGLGLGAWGLGLGAWGLGLLGYARTIAHCVLRSHGVTWWRHGVRPFGLWASDSPMCPMRPCHAFGCAGVIRLVWSFRQIVFWISVATLRALYAPHFYTTFYICIIMNIFHIKTPTSLNSQTPQNPGNSRA